MIENDLQMNTVKEVNRERTRKYLDKLNAHQNPLALNLFDNSEDIYRLKLIMYLTYQHDLRTVC
jgi:hypothetical protein